MTMVLETDRLMLREWSSDDAEAAFVFRGDPAVSRYLSATGEPHPDVAYTRSWLEEFIARYPVWNGLGHWAIVEKESGEVIGGAGLEELEENPDPQVFYNLRLDRWGRGYATEVARALIDHAFSHLGLSRVVGVAFADNAASLQVLHKTGMTYRGQVFAYGHQLEYFVIDRPPVDQPRG